MSKYPLSSDCCSSGCVRQIRAGLCWMWAAVLVADGCVSGRDFISAFINSLCLSSESGQVNLNTFWTVSLWLQPICDGDRRKRRHESVKATERWNRFVLIQTQQHTIVSVLSNTGRRKLTRLALHAAWISSYYWLIINIPLWLHVEVNVLLMV